MRRWRASKALHPKYPRPDIQKSRHSKSQIIVKYCERDPGPPPAQLTCILLRFAFGTCLLNTSVRFTSIVHHISTLQSLSVYDLLATFLIMKFLFLRSSRLPVLCGNCANIGKVWLPAVCSGLLTYSACTSFRCNGRLDHEFKKRCAGIRLYTSDKIPIKIYE